MVVNSGDAPCQLMEADIIEPLERCSIYLAHTVVRNQEILLPAHEDIFPLGKIFVDIIWLFCLLQNGLVCREFGPMLKVGLLICSPFSVAGLERVFWPNHFGLKVCSQGWVIVSKTWGVLGQY